MAQSPLNGSFEAYAGGCQYNIANATYSAAMPNSTGFGVASQLDIINSGCGFGAAQSGSWFIAMAVDISNTQNDAFSLTLSSALVMGNSYSLTFYDRGWAPYATNTLEIGISTTPSTFGTLIYTTPLPTIGTWVLRTVNFVAPNNGQYLTLRTVVGAYGWTHVDNFQITTPLPANDLQLQGVMLAGTADSLYWQEAAPGQGIVSLQVMDPNGAFVNTGTVVNRDPHKNASAVVYDPGTPGRHLYRLKLQQTDGEESFSEVLVLERAAAPASPELTLYPNPTDGVFYLSGDEEGVISIFDMSGKKVSALITDPTGQTRLDLTGYAAGLYTVEVIWPGGKRAVKKILLQ